jgi:hypothetical protein
MEGLTPDEKKALIPMGMQYGSNTANLFLKSYYRDNLWPEKRKKSFWLKME